MSPSGRRHFKRYGLIISGAVFIIVYMALSAGLLDRLEYAAYDLRFRFRGERPAQAPVLIIQIDDESLREIGRWPWPRDTHSELIGILNEYGAESVFFDILFIDEDRADPSQDERLAAAVKEAGNVFLPYYFPLFADTGSPALPAGFSAHGILNEDYGSFWNPQDVEARFEKLFLSAGGSGFVNGSPDDDGIYRQGLLFIRYLDRIYPGIALSLAARHLGADLDKSDIRPGRYVTLYPEGAGPVRIPVNEYCQMYINYKGGPDTYDSLSYYTLLKLHRDASDSGELRRELEDDISGKTVFIGITATGSTDIAPTPFHPAYPMVGAHANIFDNIINSEFIAYPSRFGEAAIFIALAIFLGLLLPALSPVKGAVLAFSTVLIYLAVNFFLFNSLGINYTIIYPLSGIILTDLILFVYKYATEEKEKRRVRSVFSTYMTPSVVNQILVNPGALKLGGERREMTVFFSDLSGFTTISESLSPEDLVHLINEYLEAMTKIIFRYEGTLDKYEGDAIMAFWNAPLDQPDHALRCVKAALDCFEELGRLQKKWKSEGVPELDMRIGINTGPMIVGNMGSLTRMDYTVMGDAVNLGARLESANKAYCTRLMISEFTKEHLGDEIITRELDALKVKGKTRPVYVYEAIALKGQLAEDMQRLLPLYEKGLGLYRERKWDEASGCFSEALEIIPGDGPSATCLERCRIYRENPPPPDWNGAWELTSK